MTVIRDPFPPIDDTLHAMSKVISLGENSIAVAVCGPHHSHLAQIETVLEVEINSRGNKITVIGNKDDIVIVQQVIDGLKLRAEAGEDVDSEDVESMLRIIKGQGGSLPDSDIFVHLKQRKILPRSLNQAEYLRAIDKSQLVIAEGPAGTGKTYLAVVKAIEALSKGLVDRIILSRPAVEAGEQLGFLPGDLRDKVDPYLRPLFDVLNEMLPSAQVVKRLERGEIEVAPLAFMRGRSLNNAFIILDEAQNTTAIQMKMFLTRLGKHSSLVVTGDLSQVDLPRDTCSGLRDAMEVLSAVSGISFVTFDHKDVVRHPLVRRIVRAYDSSQSKQQYKQEDRSNF